MYTKEDAIKEINETQDSYVDQLIHIVKENNAGHVALKEVSFTSPTGTGKTVMVAKLINKLPGYFFVVTTLSRGQLRIQIDNKLHELSEHGNFIVYGLNDYTRATHLQSDDILKSIPWEQKVIWIRDEGHIATNRWAEVLKERADLIVDFSATNKIDNGIQCNFTHTMMLRTVTQDVGSPEDALDKLVEVKKAHRNVMGYNPCALFRILHDKNVQYIYEACEERGLTYQNITEENFDMEDLCRDDNPCDVIINKFKITEGIDLRRCHVIYMDSKPSNPATVVQVIGRARRNALFWRTDIDILKPAYSELLDETRRCYVFYNVRETEVEIGENGDFLLTLCDTVSVEAFKPGIKIKVVNGRLPNGLSVLELQGKTGTFHISYDDTYHCNVVDNPSFYELSYGYKNEGVIDLSDDNISIKTIRVKPNILDFFYYENWRGDWSSDANKVRFYLWREAAKKVSTDIDFDYWGSYLEVERKDVLIDRDRFNRFIREASIPKYLEKVKQSDFGISIETRSVAMAFAKKGPSLIPLEKRNIFARGKYGFEMTLAPCFLPFVDSVTYYDFSVPERIEMAVEKRNNVEWLAPNRYRVSQHPLSDYLKNKGYSTFKDFENAVISYEGKALFRVKIEYWREAIKNAHSYPQLDQYDTRIVDLKTINDLLKIGLTKTEIKYYSKGMLIERTCSGKGLAKLLVCKLDDIGLPDYRRRPKKDLYRQSFVDKYVAYEKVDNDREIGIVGPDSMKYVNGGYIEDRSVTSKINRFCKFAQFIKRRYSKEIEVGREQLFSGSNAFDFDKKCDSCLGFCVEYYSKLKIYGDDLYRAYIDTALSEAKTKEVTDAIRVRAAMLIYRAEMAACYGHALMGIIPTISVQNLIDESYELFVSKVVELGNKTADYVLHTLYGGELPKGKKLFDPNLSVNHISALCDFITEDTILDLKCTSSIEEKHLLQVLAYHYLSTKRSDLHINRLIIFEAVTGKTLTINL